MIPRRAILLKENQNNHMVKTKTTTTAYKVSFSVMKK